MGKLRALALLLAAGWLCAGCGRSIPYDGPTVDAFVGRVTSNGKPVAIPAGQEMTLHVFHEKGQSFGIPIQPDGTFKIGWMPIGKYAVTASKTSPTQKGQPPKVTVPAGLTIEKGKTEYTIELGPSWGQLTAPGS